MRNQPETKHEYNIPRLHWWFLLSSLAFLGCLVLMIWVDYSGGEIKWLGIHGDRQWKKYQKKFYALEIERLRFDEHAAQIKANESGLEKYKKDKLVAEQTLAGKHAEEARVRAEYDKFQVARELVTRKFTMEKAIRDEVRSFYEGAFERKNHNLEDPEVREWIRKVKAQNEAVDDLELEKQKADAAFEAVEAKLNAIVGEKEQLQKKINRLESSIELLSKRKDELTSPYVQNLVNAPVIEFAAANIRVEQIVTEDHHVDVNFTTVPRVDRCITCHKAIDRKELSQDESTWRSKNKIGHVEWSKLDQPLQSHPRLDLFVDDLSPHPMSTYGCTSCHWGWDRETDFSRAGHTPDEEDKHPYVFNEDEKLWVKTHIKDHAEDDEEYKGSPHFESDVVHMTQKVAWEKNYSWEEQEFLLQPMRASKYVQASCLKCHSNQTTVDGAEKLDHGRRLIEQIGCWSCHKMQQMESYNIHRVAFGETFEEICKAYDVDASQVRKLNNISQPVTLRVGQEITIPIRTLRKVGPSLYKIAGKTTRDWVRKWLANPVGFHPNTYMPQFWGLENSADPDRDIVEINAVTEFLFAVSEQPKYVAPPVKGDADRGEKLITQLGCMACHVVDEKLTDLEVPQNLQKFMDNWDYRRFRSQGPQLYGIGSKTSIDWLYQWLKDPKQYHPETKMPNLRLTDQEAADVGEYLVSLRNPVTDEQNQNVREEVNKHVLDSVVLEYLEVTLPRSQAEEKIHNLDNLIEQYFADAETLPYFQDPARLAREKVRQKELEEQYEEEYDDAIGLQAEKLASKLEKIRLQIEATRARTATLSDDQKKNVYLGSKLVGRYGCFACHDINGFQTAKPIGTELSEWGSKRTSKLDFGLLDIEHSRTAWIHQKLRAPRSFDRGRIGITRKPQELLKMPKFNLTDEQVEQIITVVSGMTDEKLTPNEPRQLTQAEFSIERGRWLTKELNCAGCHQIEGKGWAIRATGIREGLEPPMLSGTATQMRQGQRTQHDWLFHFLKAPQTGDIRPWLKVRMPTFDLSDAEANVLVKYFALEGRTQFPYQSDSSPKMAEHMAAGKHLFEMLQCAKCHIVEGMALGKPLAEISEENLPQLAPDLTKAHTRLQRDWLVDKWLPDPLSQQPGTRMPQFEYGPGLAPNVLDGDGRKQVEALADYILSLGMPEAALDERNTEANVVSH